MDRIIFFDIDKTLFDRIRFLENFYAILKLEFKLNDKQIFEIKNFYEQVKDEFGYFSPQALLIKIYNLYPGLNNKLNYYFEPRNLNNFLFEDSEILFELKEIRVGIFSKGDRALQEFKITRFEDVIEDDLIYIYHEKIINVPDVIEKYKDSKIFIVEDRIDVLLKAKEVEEGVVTILIDRNHEFTRINGVDFKINTLFDIISILDESQ